MHIILVIGCHVGVVYGSFYSVTDIRCSHFRSTVLSVLSMSLFVTVSMLYVRFGQCAVRIVL